VPILGTVFLISPFHVGSFACNLLSRLLTYPRVGLFSPLVRFSKVQTLRLEGMESSYFDVRGDPLPTSLSVKFLSFLLALLFCPLPRDAFKLTTEDQSLHLTDSLSLTSCFPLDLGQFLRSFSRALGHVRARLPSKVCFMDTKGVELNVRPLVFLSEFPHPREPFLFSNSQ